ncbi:mediator of RNA polymerase II transcription subunit 30 [Euwallacea fornicatus]|uniref:mediator of RNA polymerase II transcription subunit 30 n=1 Tax=Euwallacea fornicatus TaxID=995702 RepID=UPI00338E50EC
MAAPSHHFMQNMNNPNQGSLRTSFGPATMQNAMDTSGMQTAMPGQMGPQMSQIGNPLLSQLNNTMGGAISPINSQLGGPMQGGIGPGSMQGNMPNQMGGQIPQLGNPMMGQIANPLSGAMSPINTAMNEFNQGLNHPMHPGAQTPGVVPTPPQNQTAQQQQQSKEFNTASLCRLGQETVQDIVSRTQEVFQTLKAIQPPAGTAQSVNVSNEKKAKVQELLRTIRVLFKRLRLIYEKCNENCQIQGMEYTHIESLIPFKDELDPKHDEKKNSEPYRLALEESKEVMEQVVLKNKQLKEVIDHLRRIVWEINTMLTMRKS